MPDRPTHTGSHKKARHGYVVLTAERPQVIIIDEPQSFLHPGAVRKLMEILRQHP